MYQLTILFSLVFIAQGSSVHYISKPDTPATHVTGPGVRMNRDSPDRFLRFWTEDSWVTNDTKSLYHLDDGVVTVTSSGVYMIYLSVTYHDLTGRWAAGVMLSNVEKVKCISSEQLKDVSRMHPTSHGVYQQCFVTFVTHLRKNQNISIQCMYGSRKIMTLPEFTFWGIVKMS